MSGEATDRRRWSRISPPERRAYVGWWEGGTFRTAAARLTTISRGGASVEADAVPPDGAPVWLCAATTGGSGWVEAAVRSSWRRPRGPHRLCLVFRDPEATAPLLEAVTLPDARPPDAPPADALTLLGLSWPCTAAEAKRAYHRLALREHPDQGGTPERFHRLKDSYAAVRSRCEGSTAERAAAS